MRTASAFEQGLARRDLFRQRGCDHGEARRQTCGGDPDRYTYMWSIRSNPPVVESQQRQINQRKIDSSA